MTQEEKAKAYDEALERARIWKEKSGMPKDRQSILDDIFPELKESEDEKIRKELIDFFQDWHKIKPSRLSVNVSDILAWLEKQGEKKSVTIDINKMVSKYSHTKDGDFGFPLNCQLRSYRQGINDALNLSLNIEKQGEQNPFDYENVNIQQNDFAPKSVLEAIKEKKVDNANKVELEFNVGDWITFYGGEPFKILKVEAEVNGILDYLLLNQNGHDSFYNKKYVDENARLWTIEDAKDGDVLVDGDAIILFKSIGNENFNNVIDYYTYISSVSEEFIVQEGGQYWGDIQDCTLIPATKEQRDLLFSKMKEAGYEWDAEKKELRKIEQKPTQETKPFEVEHGKYYYCIKDCFCGGKKQASKGDVIQALRGLPIIGLKNASEYFLPVNLIKEIW